MLKSHMDAVEDSLVATSRIPANSGHSLHKGTPREAFIRTYLQAHLPETVAIGTGEIIDSNSRPGERRNQFDIVLYKKNYPKLDFGGGISGFLVESVIATVEVKSTLSRPDLEQAIGAARAAKALHPNVVTSFHAGYVPPSVLNYVVAYDGPAQMETVYNWIPQIHESLGINTADLPLDPNARPTVPSPSVDGVFVLKKGFLYFDNAPYGFATPEMRNLHPNAKWVYADSPSGNLLMLFLMLQTATATVEGKWLNPLPYMSNFNLPGIRLGLI